MTAMTASLAQYVTTCPCCAGVAAAHVDTSQTSAVLVRLVCHDGCTVDPVVVLQQLGLIAPDPVSTQAA